MLHFETLGDPHKPALMLVHGFMSCNAQWLTNQQELSKQHYLVMIELWGHGQSPLPEDRSQYSIDGYITAFEAIREQLDIARWSVLGQSYGAGLVIRYALAHSAQVDRVIVSNSRSAFGHPGKDDDGRTRPDLNAPDLDLRRLHFHPAHARRFPEHVKAALVESADRMSVEAVRLSGGLVSQLNCEDQLSKLSHPTLLTNGIYERAFQKDVARVRGQHPQLDIVDLEGGHSVNIEAPDAFNKTVLDFLQQQ